MPESTSSMGLLEGSDTGERFAALMRSLRLLLNRRAYVLQSETPHPASGRHYYYRPRRRGDELPITPRDIQRHLAGEITLGIYAINPRTQRVKWMAIDADYRKALEDLLKLQFELGQSGIQAALEQSRRGGHLWIFFEEPVLAKHARVYIRHLAKRLSVGVKGSGTPRSGPFNGSVVNPDTGRPVILGEDQLRRADFRKLKLAETVWPDSNKSGKTFFSPLWQADNHKLHRMAAIEFIGRYLDSFFDYGIADEVHELKSGETAQGNALGTLAAACERTVVLTGTLLGGYSSNVIESNAASGISTGDSLGTCSMCQSDSQAIPFPATPGTGLKND
jgi:hypothetical protein